MSNKSNQGSLETNGYSPQKMIKTTGEGGFKGGYQPPTQNAPKTVTPPPKKP